MWFQMGWVSYRSGKKAVFKGYLVFFMFLILTKKKTEQRENVEDVNWYV